MMVTNRPVLVYVALLAYGLLMLPLSRQLLEASMTTHMLVQIPLLIMVGWVIGRRLPLGMVRYLDTWNDHGITGIVLVTIVTTIWMLPSMLDRAAADPWADGIKFLTLPVLSGLPMAVSWPRMGFVTRGVFISEFIAMFFRLGWLYLISPARLCNNYLLDDQQISGTVMLVIGSVLVVLVGIKLLWGRFDTLQGERKTHAT